MFKKQKKSIVALLVALTVASAQDAMQPPPPLTCASILCLVGTVCVDGIGCIDPDDPRNPNRCQDGEVSSPGGCLKSCDHPDFSNCDGLFFPAIFDPKFCGYNPQESRWTDYTYACQACQNPDIIGIKLEKCNCAFTGCQESQICNPDTGACEERQCSQNPPNKIFCDNKNRPTKKECPNITYIRAPDPLVCGVNSKGQRTNYPRECEACLAKNNFYYDTPCENVPPVECKSYEFCTNEGRCLDNCAFIRCTADTVCEMGACRPRVDKCATVRCKAGYQCEDGNCIPVDPCQLIDCKPGYTCYNGECIAVDQCFGHCKSYERCFQGQCRDNCDFLKCANCFQGQCGVVFDKCEFDCDCKPEEDCIDGQCVPDKCANVRCKAGYECNQGQCLREYHTIPVRDPEIPLRLPQISVRLPKIPQIPLPKKDIKWDF